MLKLTEASSSHQKGDERNYIDYKINKKLEEDADRVSPGLSFTREGGEITLKEY